MIKTLGLYAEGGLFGLIFHAQKIRPRNKIPLRTLFLCGDNEVILHLVAEWVQQGLIPSQAYNLTKYLLN